MQEETWPLKITTTKNAIQMFHSRELLQKRGSTSDTSRGSTSGTSIIFFCHVKGAQSGLYQ
jgi:hypothetical protein